MILNWVFPGWWTASVLWNLLAGGWISYCSKAQCFVPGLKSAKTCIVSPKLMAYRWSWEGKLVKQNFVFVAGKGRKYSWNNPYADGYKYYLRSSANCNFTTLRHVWFINKTFCLQMLFHLLNNLIFHLSFHNCFLLLFLGILVYWFNNSSFTTHSYALHFICIMRCGSSNRFIMKDKCNILNLIRSFPTW